MLAAAQDGGLDALAERAALDLVVVFGSVVDPSVAEPGDLDIAVRFTDRTSCDLVGAADALAALAGADVDLLDLGCADVVARSRAIGPVCLPLYERQPGMFANAQMAALAEAMETAPMRRRDLELLARR